MRRLGLGALLVAIAAGTWIVACQTPSTPPPAATPAPAVAPDSGEAADAETEDEATIAVADADTFARHARAAAKT